MKTENKNRGINLLTISVLVFLAFFSIYNMGLAKEPVQQLVKKEISFSEFVSNIQSAYISDDLKQKEIFININGLFARLTGRRECNEVVLLNNGMLSDVQQKESVSSLAEGIIELKDYLDNNQFETKFIYVQAPYKDPLEGDMFPEGITSYANDNADELLQTLQKANVSTLDLRPLIAPTTETIEKYFFGTDHHWNYTGAFAAFQEITRQISSMFPEEKINSEYTKMEQWEVHTLHNWSLGSWGKRVGSWFAGTDDFTYYTPRFDTYISCANARPRKLYKGDFTDAHIHEKHIEEKDYFKKNAYCLYGGGNYPIIQVRNPKASNDLKILMIGDSFSVPVYAYLSTVFAEIDVIDMRYYKDIPLAQYIENESHDLVLVMLNPMLIKDSEMYWNRDLVGINIQDSNKVKTKQKKHGDIEVSKKKSYKSVPVQYGKKYILRFDDVVYEGKEAQGAAISLYNKLTEERISSVVFDVEYCRNEGEFEWSFKTPPTGEGELLLQFYAGTPDKSKKFGAIYKNVTLEYSTMKYGIAEE